jgi:tRNA (guanine37-N1)-methyltransferase
MDVPRVLLSGDHRAIEKWRRDEAERLTRERRPDLWERYRADNGSPENSGDESFS